MRSISRAASCSCWARRAPGIRPLVRQRCDASVRIPMHGAIGSLNVSVAASLLLYEADRQRRLASLNELLLGAKAGRQANTLFVRSGKCTSAHLRSRAYVLCSTPSVAQVEVEI